MDRVDYESVIIQDLLSAHARNELNITPWYQRRSVWRPAQKAYLINSIHENKPVPSIYIRHSIDLVQEKSIKEVVDGQQRVRCVLEYRDDRFRAKHPQHKRPVLFSDLTLPQRNKFLLTSLSVGYLVGAEDSDVIEIFARINSVAKTLNPQEKRNAQFSGEFKQFCLGQAVARLALWRRYGIFSDNDIARMTEVQWVSDLIMNLVEGLQDFSAQRLSKYYEKYDDDFAMQDSVSERLDWLFSRLLEVEPELIRNTVFARPQILFSLLVVLDGMRPNTPKAQTMVELLVEFDARVSLMKAGESDDALPTDTFVAFTTGNMHRIRFRKKRDETLRTLLG